MAEKWQVTFAKAKMVDNEEDMAIKASPTNMFSLSLQEGGLAAMLQALQDAHKNMNEFASQAQPQQLSGKYKFSTMISQMQKHNGDFLAGRTSSHAVVAS